MAEEKKPIWEGKVSAKLNGTTADKVWPLLEDFCSLNKWLQTIDTCYKVDGAYGQPGLIRYCGSTISSSSNGSDKSMIMWCHEKLLEIDSIKRALSYEILENNMGFKQYKGTFEVVPIDDDGEEGCEIVWRFVADPVEGWKYEDLLGYIESSLHGMAEKMQNAFRIR